MARLAATANARVLLYIRAISPLNKKNLANRVDCVDLYCALHEEIFGSVLSASDAIIISRNTAAMAPLPTYLQYNCCLWIDYFLVATVVLVVAFLFSL